MPDQAAARIRLVTINIWDLPIPLPGIARRKRRRRLLRALPALDADVVAIQEAFKPRFRHRIDAALPDLHAPDAHDATRRHRFIRLDTTGGLFTLARWPIRRLEFQPTRGFPGMKPDERVGKKGCLWTELDTPAGSVTIGNVHLYAGGTPVDGRVRTVQCRQIAERASSWPGPIILAGDFNMALEYERADREVVGFDVMREAGFAEVADGRSAGVETMAPSKNRYARYMPWHRRVDRRLSQIFFRGERLRVTRPPALCLDRPPVSDHLGLIVELTLSAS